MAGLDAGISGRPGDGRVKPGHDEYGSRSSPPLWPLFDDLAPGAAEDEPAGLQPDERGESAVDLALGTGLQNMEVHPLQARRLLHLSNYLLDMPISRTYQQSNHPGLRNQLQKQLKQLGHELDP